MTDRLERPLLASAGGVDEFWAAVAPAWRDCFLLAWESFQAHSIPVGAVLVDAGETIVARGRNRWNETDVVAGQIGGSNLAHAEINALATLTPGDYSDHVLYSTLEPCFLCTAALRHSHIGAVRFAAPDPMWSGIDQLPTLNQHMARRWARRQGPLGGPLQTLAAVLHLVSALERDIRTVVECHETAMPDALRVARKLAGPAADDLRAMTLPEALTTLWPTLVTSETVESATLTGPG
ncbi:nucleoside deaminase [Dactylosporangium sp. CA-092794]|uniref:nucleoside deaminase n=1 Tax=Dactylosporangium sp. CA-092794 TaxID=3239929 RepID=UPI003D91CB43